MGAVSTMGITPTVIAVEAAAPPDPAGADVPLAPQALSASIDNVAIPNKIVFFIVPLPCGLIVRSRRHSRVALGCVTLSGGGVEQNNQAEFSFMQNKPQLPQYAIESVNNALRLLLLFRDRDVLRVTDASIELGVARSTAHRLLVTLAFQGFVQQERNSRSYRAGPALMELSASPAGLREIREAAHPWMARLSADLNETVNLLILEGTGVRFIDGVECARPVRVTARTGILLPANATAGGKVLLASLTRQEVHYLTSEHLSRMTEATIMNPQEFREELDDVERLGYAINRGESMDGLHAAAVCIFNGRGHAVASLAVSVPADRGGNHRLRTLIPALREAADNIGTHLK